MVPVRTANGRTERPHAAPERRFSRKPAGCDSGSTITGATYVALPAGPVVARYPKRLVEALKKRGLAEQYEAGRARPARVTEGLESYKYLTPDQVDLAAVLGRFTAGQTSTFLSALSHENPGWEIAFENGSKPGVGPQPIDMAIALQQFAADDSWLDEEPDADLLVALESAGDSVAQPW